MSSSHNNQPYRTAYHFQPAKNWINDPNGPMIYKGIYHLFYQHNPKAPVWIQAISWGHSTSLDLVNWTHHPVIMSPSEPYDINGVWSGSATILPGDIPVMLYTGIDSNNQQVQNLALPKDLSDLYLTEWIKSPHNPLITPDETIDGTIFRDPSTAWLGRDGKWRTLIGTAMDGEGTALVYASKDFVKWERVLQPLHSTAGTGMWECVDLFPVSITETTGLPDASESGVGIVKHVLKCSMFDVLQDFYCIGMYDHEKDIFTPDVDFTAQHTGLSLDYGRFYASKSFFDTATKRRILWAWINESTDPTVNILRGWGGVQGIPRKIWLDKSGEQLIQWPIQEIEKLRTNEVKLHDEWLNGGSLLEVSGVTASQADVEISFSITEFEEVEELDPTWRNNPKELCWQKGATVRGGIGPFGLKVMASKDMQEYTAVFFRVFKDKDKYVVFMCSDQTKSSLNMEYEKSNYGAFLNVDPVNEDLSLRSLIDHSIVESFGGEGRACITARVYPTLAIDNEAHLYVFNNGYVPIKISRLSAWSMKKAQIN